MSSAVLVRPAGESDLPQVLGLERATAGAPHWNEAAYRSYLFVPDSSLQRRALFVAVTDPLARECVPRACAHSCVHGFAAASVVADEAELESIAVADAARRSGIGRLLLHAVRAWARQGGARRLLLEVRSANRGAQAFYASQGLAVGGLRRQYYSDPIEDAVLMSMDLSAADSAEKPLAEASYKPSGRTEL